MTKAITIISLMATITLSAKGQGTILWDESVNGQFSQDFHTPTSLVALQPGTNSIIGLTEIDPNGNNWVVYPDYFTLRVPNALHLNGVYLGIDNVNVWASIYTPSYQNQLGFVSNAANGDLLIQWGIASLSLGGYAFELMDNCHGAVQSRPIV